MRLPDGFYSGFPDANEELSRMGGEFLKSERRRDALVIACLAILFLQLLLLRAPLHESLWLDETLSVWVALGSFQEVIERAFLFQGQSPLYFLILKEFVGEEAHRADNEQFSTVLSFVESADWLVRREADWST